ncbi:MAG: hypothetical protein ACK5MY_02920 [Jhaorihella sp.]
MKGDPRLDPKGLIREAYRIEGITDAQCRSIFLDWALSLPDATAPGAALRELLALHGTDAPGHPMSQVMRDGLTTMSVPRRRGGWRSRNRN